VNVRVLAAAGVIALIAAVACVYLVTRQQVQLRAAGRSGVAPSRARASVERGAYLYQTAGRCAQCHASDLGGAYVLNSRLVAILWGPNLTRGNPPVGSGYSDADFERAIRRGLRPDGMRLLMMPSLDYARMSDDDVASLIAYVRSAQPVERSAPSFELGPLGRLMLLSGRLSFDSDRIPDAAPPAVPEPAGAYQARIGGCLRCHGAGGAALPATLDLAAFAAVLRTGRDPNGRAIADHSVPSAPWRESDVAALYAYFRRLKPRASRGSWRRARRGCGPASSASCA